MNAAALPVRPATRTLSVMLTYRCNAQCGDCGTFSSPHDKSDVPLDSVRRMIDEAKELGFHNVVFTGGEATLRWSDLLDGVRHAVARGFPTRLVTNAQWAVDPARAEAGIAELRAAGLGELNVSTGDEHARFVPLAHVANAAVAGVRAAMRTVVMVEMREAASVTRSIVETAIEDAGAGVLGSPLFGFVESPWMPTDAMKKSYCSSELAATEENVAGRKGCESVLQTYVLQGDGRLASCCGLGMRRVRELQHGRAQDGATLADAIADAEGDLVKQALRSIGPEKMLAWAAGHDASIGWEGLYAHRCQACLRLYKDPAVRDVLKSRLIELLPDVVFARYADEVAIPAAFRGA